MPQFWMRGTLKFFFLIEKKCFGIIPFRDVKKKLFSETEPIVGLPTYLE